MITKIMGLLDTLCVAVLFTHPYLGWKIIALAAIWLIGKGIWFGMMGSIASMIDGLIGVYILFVAFGLSWWVLTALAIIWVGAKALFTFATI